MTLFDSILTFLVKLFGGNKTASTDATAQPTEQTSTDAQPTYTMRDSVFSVMVAGETDKSVIPSIKQQMAEKNALGVFPYTISTDSWTYTINLAKDKYGNDYTDQYGLQYTATQKNK